MVAVKSNHNLDIFHSAFLSIKISQVYCLIVETIYFKVCWFSLKLVLFGILPKSEQCLFALISIWPQETLVSFVKSAWYLMYLWAIFPN